tara:strand:+ start:249 stop:611 length:363 start_codon:yes stop_codon:yes gene_type:complete
MSGNSYTTECPYCHSEMETYSDWKPYESTNHQCLECGWFTITIEGRYSLEEVNEIRSEYDEDSKPLKELKKIDFEEKKTKASKVLDNIKIYLDNNKESHITAYMLLNFIWSQELKETEWS